MTGEATEVVPILNVSDLDASFAWFAELGWHKTFDWCADGDTEPSFGGVASGRCQVFLCRDGQGGRAESAAWMSVWVDDVDAVHASLADGVVEVLDEPGDRPWGVREMLLRHPDGHVLRISQELHHHH
jgi:catechol 2,3-dioxygenase-like lactoylglutathione lyase family enzyme